MSAMPIGFVLLIGLATGGATLAGGTLILRLSSTFDVILGFSAGAIIGVALFDLLPESLALASGAHSPLSVTSAVATGFAVYLLADRGSTHLPDRRGWRRHFAPASLTVHSFIDGLAIGLAFHLSRSAGSIVAIGVLAHDFIDGANTVSVTLSSGSRVPAAHAWLAADAVAPLTGIMIASAITIPPFALALLLAAFGGFFLYIGATELLPNSQACRPGLRTAAATVAGLLLIFAVIFLFTGESSRPG